MNSERVISTYANLEKAETGKLREWLDVQGIKAVIFDLDDTLLDTFTWERTHEHQYLEYMHQRLPYIPQDELIASFRDAHHSAFLTDSVHSDRWNTVISTLGTKYGEEAGREFTLALPILWHMYEDVPALLPRARSVLDQFRDAVGKLGLVTHAEEEYTYQKLDARDIRKYFDVVQIVDARGRKTSKDWKAAIDALSVRPEEVLVIGDNVVGDIRAATEVGVKHTVVLPSPWEVYAQGEIPAQTIRAKNISDVIPQLLASR